MQWVRTEEYVYWGMVTAAFLSVAVWETFRPRRALLVPCERRWTRHAVLLVICSVATALVLRATPVVIALRVAGSRFGVFNKAWAPFAVRCALAIVALDLLRYAVHRAFHTVPILWRIHQVHHADPDFDLTTGARVHPLEVLLLQGATLGAIALLAPPVVSVLIVEVTFCFQSFFGHANAALPPGTERVLRRFYITPDIHRIHHSDVIAEQGKNLGDIFPWWDHIFGTYQAEPAAGQKGMAVGMRGLPKERSMQLGFMLAQPFLAASQAEPPETVHAG